MGYFIYLIMKKLIPLIYLFSSLPCFSQKLSPEYNLYIRKADSLFETKDYKNSAVTYSMAFKSNGWTGGLNDRYKAARAWAKSGSADSAFFQLFRFVNKGYFVGYNRVANEPDFELLKSDKRWEQLLNKIKENESFNFGFERNKDLNQLPDGWFIWGTRDYILRTDTVIKHSGRCAVRIEPFENIEKKSFGCVAYKIHNKYQGKEIEVRAWIKMENVSDAIGLLIRLDNKEANKSIGFDNMMHKAIKGTKDWTQYSVKIPLNPETASIFIGVINSGSGLVWTDDFEVLIDGKPIGD